jgi:hypothetical protein
MVRRAICRHNLLDVQARPGNSPDSAAISDPGAATASSGASAMYGASRGRQQRQQQKRLQQLERQLQHELGPRHQWLLDMHLGFACHSSSKGGLGSLHNSGGSLDSSVPPTLTDSSPAVASTVLSPRQLSWQSTGIESLSNRVVVEAGPGSPCDSSSAAQHGLHLHGPDSSGNKDDGYMPADSVAAASQQQQQQQQQQDHSACELLTLELRGLLDQHAPVQIPLLPLDVPAAVQQQQQVSLVQEQRQPCALQLPQHGQALPLPLLPTSPQRQGQQQAGPSDLDQQHLQQHRTPLLSLQQQPLEPAGPSDVEQQHLHTAVSDQGCLQCTDGAAWSSRSGSPKSAHESWPPSANVSLGSYPSTGQPLTPDQRMQLQRYLMRQQHLLQASGMRVHPSGSLPPPMLNATGRPQQASGSSNGSDAAAVSDSAESGRSGRMPQDQHRSRTYIVQGKLTTYATHPLPPLTCFTSPLTLDTHTANQDRDACPPVCAAMHSSHWQSDINTQTAGNPCPRYCRFKTLHPTWGCCVTCCILFRHWFVLNLPLNFGKLSAAYVAAAMQSTVAWAHSRTMRPRC